MTVGHESVSDSLAPIGFLKFNDSGERLLDLILLCV